MEKFYVTKFWSTQRIIAVYGSEMVFGSKETQYAVTELGEFKIGSFAFRTMESARADVRRRAAKKLAWLEKKAGEIKKLLAEIG